MRLGDLASGVVRRWARLYTAGLEDNVRHRRLAEIESDLWEHERDAVESGLRPVAFVIEVLARFLVGIPADLAWRSTAEHRRRAIGGNRMKVSLRADWWMVPTGVLALWYAWIAAAFWWAAIDIVELWPHGGSGSAQLLLVALGFAGATVGLTAGIMLRSREPKVAGAVTLACLWPAFLWLAQGARMPGYAAIAIVLAVATAAGAIQNLIRRPVAPAEQST